MSRFEGETAVVTGGGTKGIGRATAARLVSEAAQVFIIGRRENELTDAAAALGRNVTAVPGDITKPADLDRLSEAIRTHGRGLDVTSSASTSSAPCSRCRRRSRTSTTALQ